MLDGYFLRLFVDAIICRTASLLLLSCLVSSRRPDRTFNLITIPRCVRFTMHRPHAMVPDENYIALVATVLRYDRVFSYFPETAQCEPYVMRKHGGGRNIVKFPMVLFG